MVQYSFIKSSDLQRQSKTFIATNFKFSIFTSRVEVSGWPCNKTEQFLCLFWRFITFNCDRSRKSWKIIINFASPSESTYWKLQLSKAVSSTRYKYEWIYLFWSQTLAKKSVTKPLILKHITTKSYKTIFLKEEKKPVIFCIYLATYRLLK